MWIEGFAAIGVYATYFAAMTIYQHLKGIVSGSPDFRIERGWIVASYLALAILIFAGMQKRPDRCPTPEQEAANELAEDLVDSEMP